MPFFKQTPIYVILWERGCILADQL